MISDGILISKFLEYCIHLRIRWSSKTCIVVLLRTFHHVILGASWRSEYIGEIVKDAVRRDQGNWEFRPLTRNNNSRSKGGNSR